jgi:hypothetical protein
VAPQPHSSPHSRRPHSRVASCALLVSTFTYYSCIAMHPSTHVYVHTCAHPHAHSAHTVPGRRAERCIQWTHPTLCDHIAHKYRVHPAYPHAACRMLPWTGHLCSCSANRRPSQKGMPHHVLQPEALFSPIAFTSYVPRVRCCIIDSRTSARASMTSSMLRNASGTVSRSFATGAHADGSYDPERLHDEPK